MTNINISNILASSLFAGLKDTGVTENVSVSIASQGLSANQSTAPVANVDIPMPRVNLIPFMRLQFTGLNSNVSNYWFPMMGGLVVTDGQIRVICVSVGTASGRKIYFSLSNQSGSPQTFPGCTVSVHAHFYEFPWTE